MTHDSGLRTQNSQMVSDPTRPLRVALLARAVYPFHGYGGLERHMYDLTRGLLDRGVEVTLIAPPAGPARVPDHEADLALGHPRLTLTTVPYLTFPGAGRRGTTILDRSTAYPLFGWRAGRVAARLAERGAIDIVHASGASALGYARARRRRPGSTVPLVFNPHGLEEFGGTSPHRARLKQVGYWPLRRAVRYCAQAADRVIATDRALVATVLEHLHVAPDAVRVVPNAIDLHAIDRSASQTAGATLRRRLGLEAEDVVLLSVGRLAANKGFDVLLGALRTLVDRSVLRGASWRCVVVGSGPMQASLARDIGALGLDGRVVLQGSASIEDLHGWYEAATLFVHPTLYEGSSIATLEAMAHARPIVATTAGGLPDKVRPGVNGWLVAPGAGPALATAIGEALADRPGLAVLGAASRTIVEREFSTEVAMRRLLDVYHELCAG